MGNDEKSDGRLFYNPVTKKIFGSSDYRLNISCPSGQLFGLKYDVLTSYTLFNDDTSTTTPAFEIGQQITVSPTHLSHPLKRATIIDIPFKHSKSYKIKLTECNTILDISPCDILPYDPSNQVNNTGPLLLNPWFKHKARCTIFLTEYMAIPKHGIIVKDGSHWNVHLGHTLQSKSRNKKPVIILKGWKKSKSMLQEIENRKTFNFIAHQVTFINSSDPAHLTNESVQTKIDRFTEPDIIGFTKMECQTAQNIES